MAEPAVTLAGLLRHPVIAAPMAGGVSTPALVAAVADGGGLGFLAAGYRTPEDLTKDIAAVRASTAAPFGVNVFVPARRAFADGAVRTYRHELEAETQRHGAGPGEVPADHTDGFRAKVDLLAAERIPVVSFTFGCPAASTVDVLHAAGSLVVVTVTSGAEALIAARAGADALCVQGPEAGGHRGSFEPARPGTESIGLLPLLAEVRAAVPGLPMIAAGGIMDGAGIVAVLSAGAVAAQLGTALLRTPESGANRAYKAALVDPGYGGTSVTLAFTGRPARGLTNRFMTDHGMRAPMAYPDVHFMTAPIRRAAAAAGDAGGMALWAGQGHRLAREVPAADLVRTLLTEAETAAAQVADRLRPPVTTT